MSWTFTHKMHLESSNKIIIKKSDLKRVTEISQEAERKRKYRRLIKSIEDVSHDNLLRDVKTELKLNWTELKQWSSQFQFKIL